MRVDCCQDSFRLPSWARLVCPRLPANHSDQTFTRFLASMKTSPPRLAISTKGPLLAPGLPSQRRDHLVQANVGGWRQDPGGQWMGNGGFQNRWPSSSSFFWRSVNQGKLMETLHFLMCHYCFITVSFMLINKSLRPHLAWRSVPLSVPSPVIEAVPCEMEVGASRVSFKHLSAKKTSWGELEMVGN